MNGLVVVPQSAPVPSEEGQSLARRGLTALSVFGDAPASAAADALLQEGLEYFCGSRSKPEDRTRARDLIGRAAEHGHQRAQAALTLFEGGVRGPLYPWVHQQASIGDALCQCVLGIDHFRGKGCVPQNDDQAAHWLQKAAEQGHAHAQMFWAVMLDNGRGVATDRAEALFWFQEAAVQGHARALSYLGSRYKNGEGVAMDLHKALQFYRKAAEQGDAQAQYELAGAYARGASANREDSASVFSRMAALGNVKGHPVGTPAYLVELAMWASAGLPVDQDDEQAAYWYAKAAEQDHVEAQFFLAGRLGAGMGVARDEQKAAQWYRRAAENGNAAAQFELGMRFANGQGVDADNLAAMAWLRRSAELGNADAQTKLGIGYHLGLGGPDLVAEGLRWLHKAAEKHREAQFYLAKLYDTGSDGVAQDKDEALRWYRKAAASGHLGAIELVGRSDEQQDT